MSTAAWHAGSAGCLPQLFVYSVPAQQQQFARVHLPVPSAAPPPPWMSREPGAVSLAAVMRGLQAAHAAVHQQRHQQQLQWLHHRQAATAGHKAQEDKLQQHQPRAHRGQRKRHQHTNQAVTPSGACLGPEAGWTRLAAVITAADKHTPTWLQQQQLVWSTAAGRVAHALVTLAAGGQPQQPTSAAVAATPACRQPPPSAPSGPPAAGLVGSTSSSSSSGSPSLPSPDIQAEVMPLVVQQLLGLLTALNLLLHQETLLAAAAAAVHWLQHAVLEPHIQWLMQAHPGGIKLHLELSLLLGTAADLYLQLAARLYGCCWPWLGRGALLLLAAAAAVGGASRACVAAADLLLLLLAPLVLLYVLTAQLHRLQLHCLGITWRLIRGKQKVRRFSSHHRSQGQQPHQQHQQQPPHSTSAQQPHQPASPAALPPAAMATQPSSSRSGSRAAEDASGSGEPGDEVSVDQLIVGVLLFTPLLGLLPTTVAWYLSVAGLYGCLHALRLLLVAGGSWMQLRPLHVLAARWRRPQLFPGNLLVLPLESSSEAPHTTAAAAAGGLLTRRSTASIAISSSSSRAADVPASGCTGKGGGCEGGSSSLQVSSYHIFYEPLSYWDVLVHSVAQQQGLLWRVCLGAEGGTVGHGSAGAAAPFVGWLRALAAGRTWALGLLSTRWRWL